MIISHFSALVKDKFVNFDMKEIRARRKALGLSQEAVARWLDINRTTYAKKELGTIPTTTKEYQAICEGLDRTLQSLNREKEVMETYGSIDRDVLRRLAEIYRDGIAKDIESGIRWMLDLAERGRMLNEIIDKLNKLITANEGFNRRLDDLETLVKSGSPDEKPAVEEMNQGEAAAKSTLSK